MYLLVTLTSRFSNFREQWASLMMLERFARSPLEGALSFAHPLSAQYQSDERQKGMTRCLKTALD